MKWNYTKTTAFILLGTLAVKVVAEQAIGANIYKAGGAVPTIMLAVVVLLPIMAVADFLVHRKSRRDRHPE